MALYAALKINRYLSQAVFCNKYDLITLNPHLRFKSCLSQRVIAKSNDDLVKNTTLPLKNESSYNTSQQQYNQEQNEYEGQICSKFDDTYEKSQKLKFSKDDPKHEVNINEYADCNYQPAKHPQYYSSSLEVANVRFPENNIPRRIFPKSSTHNALTMPLKMSRLANPFPDQVIVLQSQTVSDQEKAEIMENEIKMETRFKLEMQQEQLQNKQEKCESRNYNKNNSQQISKMQQRYYSTVSYIKFNPVNILSGKIFASDINFTSHRLFAKCKKPEKKEEKVCPKSKLPGCKEAHDSCVYPIKSTDCKKLNAPYPSYSECMGDTYEELPDECRDCPWGSMPTWDGKRKYSTSAANAEMKKNKPCPNPYPDKKPCDYEKTAENRKRKPQKEGQKGKKCSAIESSKMSLANIVKGWLNRWNNESEVIKVSKPENTEPGKETYVVEIYDDGPSKIKTANLEAVNDDNIIEIVEPETTEEGMDLSGCEKKKKPSTCKKIPSGCGKKKEKSKELPKKCKKPKKRKVPTCDDIGKKAQSSLSINDIQNELEVNVEEKQEINIDGMSLPNKLEEESPVYKLKKEHWKINTKLVNTDASK